MSNKQTPNRIFLSREELPKQWYNIQSEFATPLAPYVAPDGSPIGVDAMSGIFARELCEQEFSTERYIDIPKDVLDTLARFRPSPLIRAYGLEKALDTPAKIYYKYEGENPSGSHKLNTAIPQAYYNKIEGITGLTTETGAGQWGVACSVAASMFDLDLKIFMVKVSMEQKPYRAIMMRSYGGEVTASPSMETEAGRMILAKDPNARGTLGGAISEAVELALKDPKVKYVLGSVLNHVILHQSIIGQEAMKQMEYMDDYPDYVIACNGGGSNFGGIAMPFLGKQMREGGNTKFIAVEPAACPKLTKGKFAYDYADEAEMTPILPMYTLGHEFSPAGIHSGGLRYHGDSPILSKLYNEGLVQAEAYTQNKVFEAALQFAKAEFILPAPESAHAIAGAINQALKCKAEGKEETILFNVSGHGYLDLSAYDSYLSGGLDDYEYEPEGEENLPNVGAIS